MSVKRILAIAGSDSSGGAGLEADQKVIAAHGCYAMTATTALTAQNTLGVYGIQETPPPFVQKQIEACIDDIGVDVVKTGMLASAAHISVVAGAIRKYNLESVIVDPVMVSTSGVRLLSEDAIQVLIESLLPLTSVLTPNIPEAKLLLAKSGQHSEDPRTVDDIIQMAKSLKKLGPKYILLKGGHTPLTKDRLVAIEEADKQTVLNVLLGDHQPVFFESPYLKSRNTHGTGCSLASAIASNIANGMNVPEAVRAASKYVEAGIKYSVNLGQGNGPIDHFHSLYSLPYPRGNFIEYLLNREDVKVAWKEYTEHDFVQKLAAGTLDLEHFKRYLIQDYLFLIQFSRANALAAYKASNFSDIKRSAEIVMSLQEEVKLHVDYCNRFGISEKDMAACEEDPACTAYTRYVLDIGQSQDLFALQVAMLPCLLGYGMIAQRLYDDPNTVRENNKYWEWILAYVDEKYKEAVRTGSEFIEDYAIRQSRDRVEEVVKIFVHATKMETGFWSMR